MTLWIVWPFSDMQNYRGAKGKCDWIFSDMQNYKGAKVGRKAWNIIIYFSDMWDHKDAKVSRDLWRNNNTFSSI